MGSQPNDFLRSDTLSLVSEYLSKSNDINLKQRLSSQLVALLQDACAVDGRSSSTSADPELQLTHLLSHLVKNALPTSAKSTSTSFTPANIQSFLSESICILADEQINARLSELLADTIWSIESEIEAQHSSLEEQLKTLSTDSAQVVTGSADVDNSTDAPPPNIHVTSRKIKLESLSRSRMALIQLAIVLLQPDKKKLCCSSTRTLSAELGVRIFI